MADLLSPTPTTENQLSAAKQALRAKLRQGQCKGLRHDAILPRHPGQPALPLSFAQQRLWFLDRMETGAAYHIPLALEIQGVLNTPALQQALNEIVQRHESLRTIFKADGVETEQIIQNQVKLELPYLHLQTRSAAEQTVILQQLRHNEATRPFDLTKDLMLRGQLVCLEVQKHILFLTLHHIAGDGWSLGVLMEELRVLYAAFCTGQPSALPPLPIQYADFTLWQRQRLQGERLAKLLAYWQTQLADAPSLLQLPTDRPRPLQQTYAGSLVAARLDAALVKRLRALSRQADATLFMTLLAAFQTLLYRYSGSEDLVVGTAIANRNQREVEPLIGFFVNVLALRADLSGNPTFWALLQQARQVALAAYEHQDLPFERLVEALQPARNPAYPPLVQVHITLQNAPARGFALADLQVMLLAEETINTRADLELFLEEIGEELELTCVYNTDLFDATTIQRLVAHYRTLLVGIVADPHQHIASLPLLDVAERRQLLCEWNNTVADYPIDRCIHHLFEEQVERTPAAVALVVEEQQLTYRQLNERANQLAHHLQQLGIGAEALVGVGMERSLEMVVSFWAILKAGGVYLPLDPGYPPDRLAFMLTDAAPALVVSKNQYRALFPANMPLLCLDAAEAEVDAQPTTNPCANSTGTSLAYVIYTSGSTGKPKGVLVEHGGLGNLAYAQREQFAVAAESRFLQLVSPNFDVAIGELVTCFCAGATLVLVPPDLLLASEQLTQLINHYAVTHVEIPPVLLATLNPALLPTLQSVMTGGESFSADLARRWSAKARFINVYGPTETTVSATLLNCTALPKGTQSPPIGKPLANKQIYLLDVALQPVPIGVPGELYIGGVGVARGYLKRPESTAERFIANPFAAGRLYRTGDLARWLPDGNIEFIGRIDQQVKIRGFRIELGEIEAILHQHPAVQEAVVIARDDTPNEKRLVAYVVTKDKLTSWQADQMNSRSEDVILSPPHPLTLSDTLASLSASLRSHLQQKLPAYMLPSAFVLLEALPVTPNGKVDRKALPAPDLSTLASRETVVPPRTPTEVILAQIWSEVLGVAQVGRHDNFFQLGGHSLLAIQVVARLRTQQNWEVPLRQLFDQPTIAALAAWLDQEQVGEPSATQQPGGRLQPVARTQPLPLSFNQEDAWLLRQSTTIRSVHQQNSGATYRLRGKLNVPALQQSINVLIQRHEILRTIFVPMDNTQPSALPATVGQVVVAEAVIALSVLDLSPLSPAAQAEETARLQQAEQVTPLDLTQAPALRVSLIRLGSEEHLLLLTIHHITVDAWSMGILWKELSEIYRAAVLQEAPALTPLTIQYADFAHWQRQYFTADRLAARQYYWRQFFATPPPPLHLQTDYPRPAKPAGQGYPAGEELLTINHTLVNKLTLLSQQHETTLAVILLAAYATTLYAYSGCEDVLIFAPSSNRNQPELESLIGYFTGLALLRIDLAAAPDLRELIARTKDVMLAALTNQDLSLRHLLRATSPDWLPCAFPEREALFNFTPVMVTKSKLPDLTIAPEASPLSTIVADLALYLTPEPGDNTGDRTGLAWQGSFYYRRDLFAPTTIRQMVQTFQQILEAMPIEPSQCITTYRQKAT